MSLIPTWSTGLAAGLFILLLWYSLIIAFTFLLQSFGTKTSRWPSEKARVEEVFVGFGPRIFRFELGGTIYSLHLVPLTVLAKGRGLLPSAIAASLSLLVVSLLFCWTALLASHAADMEVVAGNHDGLRVLDLKNGGTALNSGLKPDDLITSVDGRPIVTGEELAVAVQKQAPLVQLEIVRSGEKSIQALPTRDEEGKRLDIGLSVKRAGTVGAAALDPLRLFWEALSNMWGPVDEKADGFYLARGELDRSGFFSSLVLTSMVLSTGAFLIANWNVFFILFGIRGGALPLAIASALVPGFPILGRMFLVVLFGFVALFPFLERTGNARFWVAVLGVVAVWLSYGSVYLRFYFGLLAALSQGFGWAVQWQF